MKIYHELYLMREALFLIFSLNIEAKGMQKGFSVL